MDVIPLGPGFGAELRGVTLADVAADDAAYAAVRAAFEDIPCWCFATSTSPTTSSLRFRAASARRKSPKSARMGTGSHFVILSHHRPRRQGGAARSPAVAAQQGQPALAHRFLVQARAGADLDPVGAHHSRRMAARPNLSRPASPSSGSTRGCAKQLENSFAWHDYAHSREPDRAGARERRRSARCCRRMLAHGVAQSRQRPRRALSRLARLCDRGHGSRPPAKN